MPYPGGQQYVSGSAAKCYRTAAAATLTIMAVTKVVLKHINEILNIICNLTHLLHPNLNLLAMLISLSKILKEGGHALQLIFQILQLTPETT